MRSKPWRRSRGSDQKGPESEPEWQTTPEEIGNPPIKPAENLGFCDEMVELRGASQPREINGIRWQPGRFRPTDTQGVFDDWQPLPHQQPFHCHPGHAGILPEFEMKPHYFTQDAGDPDDMLLGMAKMQGYVPDGCLLGGNVVMTEVNGGRHPCWGCEGPRDRCGGKPKRATQETVP